MIRQDGGGRSLLRFAERGTRALVLEIGGDSSGNAKLRDVREMDRGAFDAFGNIV